MNQIRPTLTPEPVYHFWNPAGSFTLRGREAVTGFYSNMIAGGGNQFEVIVEKIVADRGSVITEGQVKQVQRGKALLAAGRTTAGGAVVAPDELFLTCAQLITVWPGDPDGKLVGEDIYFGEDALATARKISREELPAGFRLP